MGFVTPSLSTTTILRPPNPAPNSGQARLTPAAPIFPPYPAWDAAALCTEYLLYIDWDGTKPLSESVAYYRWNGVKWNNTCRWAEPVNDQGARRLRLV